MRKIIIFAISIITLFSLCSCDENIQTEDRSTSVEVEKTIEKEVTTDSVQTVDTVIVDEEENTEKEVKIELENPSPLNIANGVLEEMGATDIVINSVTDKENCIYIDFSEKSNLFNLGTSGETAILDSLGLTFVGKLKYNHVFLSVEGQPYESGHFYFDLDEPYM